MNRSGITAFVNILPSIALAVLMFESSGCAATPSSRAEKLAIPILKAEEVRKTDDEAGWKEVEERLNELYGNSTAEADEAVIILMSFYLGEHNGEELSEDLMMRGPRMIPLINRYLREEPASLLARFPKRMRLERSTVTAFLGAALEDFRSSN
jgi:hypothetical protein